MAWANVNLVSYMGRKFLSDRETSDIWFEFNLNHSKDGISFEKYYNSIKRKYENSSDI